MASPTSPPGDEPRRPDPDAMSEGHMMIDEPEPTPYYAMETGGQPGDNESDGIENFENMSMAESIVSSVMTADGIHDTTGFTVVCLIILVGDMSRGIFFPSLWPLVAAVGGTTISLGYCVAAFSLGRILVSPIYGHWSVTYGYSKTLMFATACLLIGSLAYGQCQNVGRIEFLVVAQTLLGIGSGTLGVSRAFVAEVTAQRNRTTYIAWITAVQYAGFTVTPFIGALFNSIFLNKEYKFGIFRLNMFTAPAYFLTLCIVCVMIMLQTFFRDRQRMQKSKKISARRAMIEDYGNAMTSIGLSMYDCCILGCMLLNISTKGSISSFETLGISLAMSSFGMSPTKAGLVVGTCGSLGVVVLLSMGHLSRQFSDVQLICGGMLVMAAGIGSLHMLQQDADNADWRWWFAICCIYSVGYPVGHTAVIGLFSKIVGRRPQGVLMGWFSSAGSLARITFPIMSGYVVGFFGPSTLFTILIIILCISTSFVIGAKSSLHTLSR